MGKSTRRVLGVVASIAVPFAAPALASAMGVSSFLGKVAIGAALGGGASALGGGDFGRGALLGGALTGLNVGLQGLQAAPEAAAAATAPTTTPAAAAGTLGEAAVNTQSLAGLGGNLATGAPAAVAPAGAGVLQPQFMAPNVASQVAAPAGTGVLQPQFLGTDAASVAAQRAAAGVQPSLWERIRGGIASRLSDPQQQAQLLLTAGGLMNASGLSPEQEALLAEQREELARLREQDESAFNARMAAAQAVLQEARGIDPETQGRISQATTMQNVARSQRERARAAALAPNRAGMDISTQARQAEIMGQQAGETAYQTGMESARRQRAGLFSSGAGMLPAGAYTSSFTAGGSLLGDYATADREREEEERAIGAGAAGFSNIFGGG